jgi:hypothetical protein
VLNQLVFRDLAKWDKADAGVQAVGSRLQNGGVITLIARIQQGLCGKGAAIPAPTICLQCADAVQADHSPADCKFCRSNRHIVHITDVVLQRRIGPEDYRGSLLVKAEHLHIGRRPVFGDDVGEILKLLRGLNAPDLQAIGR